MSKKRNYVLIVIQLIVICYVLFDIHNYLIYKRQNSQIHDRLDSTEFDLDLQKLSKEYPNSSITEAIKSFVEINSSMCSIDDLEHVPDKVRITDTEKNTDMKMYECELLKPYLPLMVRGNYVFFSNDIMEISYFISDKTKNNKNCCVIVTYQNDDIIEKQYEGDNIISIFYEDEE